MCLQHEARAIVKDFRQRVQFGAADTGWIVPEDSKPNELPIQESVLIKEHHATRVYTEGCTPGPQCWAGRGGRLHWLHHASDDQDASSSLHLHGGGCHVLQAMMSTQQSLEISFEIWKKRGLDSCTSWAGLLC